MSCEQPWKTYNLTLKKDNSKIYDWIELILNLLSLNVTEHDQTHKKAEAEQAKICHFRRHKHDIMMPKATLGYNSI